MIVFQFVPPACRSYMLGVALTLCAGLLAPVTAAAESYKSCPNKYLDPDWVKNCTGVCDVSWSWFGLFDRYEYHCTLLKNNNEGGPIGCGGWPAPPSDCCRCRKTSFRALQASIDIDTVFARLDEDEALSTRSKELIRVGLTGYWAALGDRSTSLITVSDETLQSIFSTGCGNLLPESERDAITKIIKDSIYGDVSIEDQLEEESAEPYLHLRQELFQLR